jgi:hypothetical protein
VSNASEVFGFSDADEFYATLGVKAIFCKFIYFLKKSVKFFKQIF